MRQEGQHAGRSAAVEGWQARVGVAMREAEAAHCSPTVTAYFRERDAGTGLRKAADWLEDHPYHVPVCLWLEMFHEAVEGGRQPIEMLWEVGLTVDPGDGPDRLSVVDSDDPLENGVLVRLHRPGAPHA